MAESPGAKPRPMGPEVENPEDPEGLAWVDEVSPEIEAALSPIERALLRALRRYRREGLKGPMEKQGG